MSWLREDATELYGPRAALVPLGMKGGYVAKETVHADRVYRGRVDVALQNTHDATDLLLTLRHEVLGHYGANTFAPAEKRALLEGIKTGRNEPTLKPLWDDINQRYAEQPLDIRAEEVFALHCEGIEPAQHQAGGDVARRGQQAFVETCIARVRPMRAEDLNSIACMVAQGLRDGTRQQQTFPQLTVQFRKDETVEPKKPFHEVVAEKLIEQLKAGTAPWQKPWEPGEPSSHIPVNPTTGKRYRGINAIQLMSEGRSDQRWMTYKQAAAVGAQVRKGERGTPIQYWKFEEEQAKTDAAGLPVRDDRGEPVKDKVKLERPRVFFATVFNAEQIDGLPPQAIREQPTWSAATRAEQILEASGAATRHSESDRAFYRPSSDTIHLPEKHQFPSADRYYAVALHELGHWTGHESRLDRDLANPFGSEGYAKEELRAEIASMVLGDELGIGRDPAQHAAYVGSWIKVLQDDPLEIFRAAADAEKIQAYVLGLELKQEQAQAQAQGTSMDANHTSGTSDLEQAARAARLKEELVRADANSTEEDIAAAKEARKDADIAAVLSSEDMQRRAANFEREKLQAAAEAGERAVEPRPPGVKTFLNVPFKEKDEAKALGAKWDRQGQSWYVPAGLDPAPFARWGKEAGLAAAAAMPPLAPPAPRRESGEALGKRKYLAVPFGEHVAAKAAGAAWDKAAKSWYVGPKADAAKLERWLPERVPAQQGPAMRPEEEFAQAMRDAGLLAGQTATGDHPIMDGKPHRVPVEGGKKGAQDGFYIGHLDGHPAGRIINNKTGADITWKSKGYALSGDEKARLQAEAASKLAERAVAHERLQEAAAQRVARQASELQPVTEPTPYMLAKGLAVHAGALTDKEGRTTYIPAADVEGKQWTMQYIQEDGTKRFAKNSRLEGCFHVIGGREALAAAPALVIAEGYATASTLSQCLGYATVAAFNSGNLAAVATALHAKYPDKPVIVAGDDDRHLELTLGANPGKVKADEAARLVGGKLLMPIFAPGENSYPADLPPVTPEAFKAHLRTGQGLSEEQLAAIDRMKATTDFNDVATRSSLGQEGLERQVRSIVEAAAAKHEAATVSQAVDVRKQALVQQDEEKRQPRQRRAARIS